MSSDELTPERIRDAAAVVELLYGNTNLAVSAKNMRLVADRRERERADDVKREKRVDQLAEELWNLRRYQDLSWDDTARALLTRYPSLLDEDGEQ